MRRKLLAAILFLILLLPAAADITMATALNSMPVPDTANVELVRQAVYRLAADARLANHPIRAYLNDPNLRARILFDQTFGGGNDNLLAGTINMNVHIPYNQDMIEYIVDLAHEFVHVAMQEKYSSDGQYPFLRPEDFAFRYLMEEAFATAIGLWARISYPDLDTNRWIRNWESYSNGNNIADAMRNDYQVRYPSYSEDQVNALVAADLVNRWMTVPTVYTRTHIPNAMSSAFRWGSTFLIAEYDAYRDRGDALLRHQWNYLLSMMPDAVQTAMRANNRTYDYYRSRFRNDVVSWSSLAATPEESILYFLNFDYVGNARQRMAAQRADERYYYFLELGDEARMNVVMREIDPRFTPVDTSRNAIRLAQEERIRIRDFGY